MNDINSLLAILTGLAVRFVIPILITLLAVAFLHKLDKQWQAEGQSNPLKLEGSQCWQVKDCPLEKRENCEAFSSNMPCWQVRRLPNGYLREKCLDCEVLYKAPVPVYA